MMQFNGTRSRLAILLVTALTASLALGGCGLVGGSGKTVSVSDPANLFHVKVPESWQSSTDQGFVSIYAARELPAENETPKALSVLVYSSKEPSSTAEAEVLSYLIDARAKQRKWKDVEKSEPQKVQVGGRDGVSVDVTATGPDGKTFESRYFFVRTGGDEFLVAFIAPDGKRIADYQRDISRIATEWYWHSKAAPDGSAEATSEP